MTKKTTVTLVTPAVQLMAFEMIESGFTDGMGEFWKHARSYRDFPHDQILRQMGRHCVREAIEFLCVFTGRVCWVLNSYQEAQKWISWLGRYDAYDITQEEVGGRFRVFFRARYADLARMGYTWEHIRNAPEDPDELIMGTTRFDLLLQPPKMQLKYETIDI
jgi:hypothetical protein